MLLEVNDLHTFLSTGNTVVRAVDGISFSMERGETFCLVGESGSGKSMTALSIIQLVPSSIGRSHGQILFEMTLPDGRRERVDVLTLPDEEKRKIRGASISMIFQEPMTSLNPVFTVGDQIMEALLLHFPTMTPREARLRAIEMMDQVRIPDPDVRIDSYPHQMSGGQRQRVMIAMALACKPDLLIADEPTTALDVTVQAEILRLIDDLQREKDMSVLFITHDLAVVSQVADRVAVMQQGKIVEQGEIGELLRNPQHPYTKELLEAVPENLARIRREREGYPAEVGTSAPQPAATTASGRQITYTPSGREQVVPSGTDQSASEPEAQISKVTFDLPPQSESAEAASPVPEALPVGTATPSPKPRYVHTGDPAKEQRFRENWRQYLLTRARAHSVAMTTMVLCLLAIVLYASAMALEVGPQWLAAPGVLLACFGLLAAVGQWHALDWARPLGRLVFSLAILRDVSYLGIFALDTLLGRHVLGTPFLPFTTEGWILPAAMLLAGPLAINVVLLTLTEHRAVHQLALSGNRIDAFARRNFGLPRLATPARAVSLLVIVGASLLLGLHAAHVMIAPAWIAPVALVSLIFAAFGVYIGGQLALGENWVRGLGMSTFGFAIPLVLVALVAVPFGAPLVSETSFLVNVAAGSTMLLLNVLFFGLMFSRTVGELGVQSSVQQGDYSKHIRYQGTGAKSLAVKVESFRFEKTRTALKGIAWMWIALAAINGLVLGLAFSGESVFGVGFVLPQHWGLFAAQWVGAGFVLVSSVWLLVQPNLLARLGLVGGVSVVLVGAGASASIGLTDLNAGEVLGLTLIGVLGLTSLRTLLRTRAALVTRFRGDVGAYATSLEVIDEPSIDPGLQRSETNPYAQAEATPLADRSQNHEKLRKGDPLVTIEGMRTYFPIKKGLLKSTVGYVKAVDGVDLVIPRGQILALVGESGCGKTTLGRSILRLIEPTAGRIVYDGLDIMHYPRSDVRPFRKEMQFIFQDPQSSLNPRLTIEHILTEPMQVHGIGTNKNERVEMARAALKRVELDPDYIYRYPHEFSGGQRQRIGIARALVLNPRFIVCDEVTSALDVSVQARILELLLELREERNLTLLFITHNIGVVEYLSDETAVMHNGQIVERGPTDWVCGDPQHAYTKKLLAAVPRIQFDRQPRQRQRADAK